MIEIISIFVTIALAIPGIIVLLRKKNTEIIYLENKQINVQDDLLKNFKDLSIEYKGTPITSRLVFVRGFIICAGSKDINSSSNTIEISSPEKTQWIDFRILDISKGLSVTSEIKDNQALVNFELFKTNEKFEFEGIVDLQTDVSLKSFTIKNIDLSFFHRIPNISPIKKFKLNAFKGLNLLLYIACMSLIVGVFMNFDTYKLDEYDLDVYNSENNLIIQNDTRLRISNGFDSIVTQVLKDNNVFTLTFTKSKVYDINYDTINPQIFSHGTKSEKIYFKKDVRVIQIIFFIMSIVLILLSLSTFYTYFKLLGRKKKYLKYIE